MPHVWPPDPSPERDALLAQIRISRDRILASGTSTLCIKTSFGLPFTSKDLKLNICPQTTFQTLSAWLENPPPPGTPFQHTDSMRAALETAFVIGSSLLGAVGGPIGAAAAGSIATAAVAGESEGIIISDEAIDAARRIAQVSGTNQLASKTAASITPAGGTAVPVARTAVPVTGLLIAGGLAGLLFLL